MCGVVGIFNFQYSNIIILELLKSLKNFKIEVEIVMVYYCQIIMKI